MERGREGWIEFDTRPLHKIWLILGGYLAARETKKNHYERGLEGGSSTLFGGFHLPFAHTAQAAISVR